MFLGAAAPVDKIYIEDVFSNYLYVGDGSARSIVNGLDLSTDGGLVWTKCRNDTYTHELVDTERGVTKVLQSDDNTAEVTEAQSVTAFNSNGYSIGTRLWVNSNDDFFSSWSFKKQAGFLDIVTWTGNDTTRNISHGLDSVPGAILIKALGSTGDWVVYHKDRGNESFGKLNTTDSFWTSNDIWDSTTPTSTTFRINGNNSFVNANNIEYVAYVFASEDQRFGVNGDEAVIKCGSWTGDGSTTEVAINVGFEPQWILTKNVTSSGGGWPILDSMRGWNHDLNDTRIEADNSDADYSSFNYSDLTATGFTTGTTTSGWNSSATYIYIAIRRPDAGVGKTVEAGTDVFAMDTGGSSADMDPPNFDAPCAVDMAIWRDTDSYDNWFFGLRSAGTSKLKPDVDASESAESGHTWDSSAGWSSLNKGSDCVSWMWKRSPGFFDCRTITCTAAADTLYDHGLGVVPEMMWFKSFDNGGSYDDWIVYHKDLDSSAPEDKYVKLSETDSVQDNTVWADTAPTATQFKIGSAMLASDDKFSVCLFASLEGVSKIGVYQATSPEANRVITTGFQPRFVMIKCIDSAEPWMVFDTLRGVGNLLKLDNAAVQSSGTFISIQSTGFTVTSTSSELNNDNDDKYLYYAIA